MLTLLQNRALVDRGLLLGVDRVLRHATAAGP